jgi:hypothetical protein
MLQCGIGLVEEVRNAGGVTRQPPIPPCMIVRWRRPTWPRRWSTVVMRRASSVEMAPRSSRKPIVSARPSKVLADFATSGFVNGSSMASIRSANISHSRSVSDSWQVVTRVDGEIRVALCAWSDFEEHY